LYRSPGNGWRIRGDVEWDMLRIPPPKTFLVDYYEYNSLNDLKPGDLIEIMRFKREEGENSLFVVTNKHSLYHILSSNLIIVINHI